MSRINVRVTSEEDFSFHDLPSPNQITYVRWLCARIMEESLKPPQSDVHHNIDSLRKILYSMGAEYQEIPRLQMDRYASSVEKRWRDRGVSRGK